MKRQMFRILLALLLVVFTFFAAMFWAADYSRNPDPRARFEIVATKVERDASFRWLEVHLKKAGDEAHDLRLPVRLLTSDGKVHQPADTTFAGNPEAGFTEIWLKFWLEPSDLDGEISLKINEGSLSVKSNKEEPEMGAKGEVVFKSEDWTKSWLGF